MIAMLWQATIDIRTPRPDPEEGQSTLAKISVRVFRHSRDPVTRCEDRMCSQVCTVRLLVPENGFDFDGPRGSQDRRA